MFAIFIYFSNKKQQSLSNLKALALIVNFLSSRGLICRDVIVLSLF